MSYQIAIFEAVDRGASQFGVAPIENSTNGIVAETHACLRNFSIQEHERTKLSISHALLRQPGSGAVPVNTVYGHEQVSCVTAMSGPPGLNLVQSQSDKAASIWQRTFPPLRYKKSTPQRWLRSMPPRIEIRPLSAL